MVELMFPKSISENEAEVFKSLDRFYDHAVHHEKLRNMVFRCHDMAKIKLYSEFIRKQSLTLKEPEISIFFPNEYFINIDSVS